MTMTKSYPLRAFAVAVFGCLVSLSPLWAQSTTTPVGYITLKVDGGTGSVRKGNLLSLPLAVPLKRDGAMTGTITNVGASTLTNANAGWTPGQLSMVAQPALVRMTSGSAAGSTFLISTATPNTATTVTIDAKNLTQGALNTLGIAAGDQYELLACDTISSFFGTPESTEVYGGANANVADNVVIVTNGASETFFYSTTLNRWTKSGLLPTDATHFPIHPDAGVYYYRLATTGFEIPLPGRVPTTKRIAWIKKSGNTVLANSWPVDTTLNEMGIHGIATWVSHASAGSADKVKTITDGVLRTFWHDGANWREETSGSPIADNTVIPAGSAVHITKNGSLTGYTQLEQSLPYSLD